MRPLIITLLVLSSVVLLVPCIPHAYASPSFSLVDAYWTGPLALGAPNTLTVKVKYTGDGTASNVTARLVVHDVAGTDLTATDEYSGSVTPGVVVGFEFTLDVPADAKASYYMAILYLNYTENGSKLTTAIQFQVGFTGVPKFSVHADKTTLNRGAKNDVVVSVSVEEAPARNVEVRVTPASAFVSVIGGNRYFKGILEAGETVEVPLSLLVDSTAGDWVAVTVTVSYRDFTDTPGTVTVTLGFTVLRKPGPHIAARLSPSRVVSGKRVAITVSLSNTGSGYARDVNVQLTPTTPGLAVLEGAAVNLGELAPGESATYRAVIRADRGLTGTATLTLRVTYFDDQGDSHMDTLTLGLEVLRGSMPLLVVEALNSTLPRNTISSLTLRVSNIGDDEAHDVVLDFVSGRGVSAVGSSRVHINRLRPGEHVNVTFKTLAVTIGTDSALIDLKVNYFDSAGYEYTDTVSIAVQLVEPGKPNIRVSSLNATLAPNRVNRVLIRVENIGDGAATNVTFSLTSQSVELGSVIGPSYRVLKRVGPNGTAILEYDIFVQPRVYGALQLLASVEYEDEWGNKYRRLMTLGYQVRGNWELSVVYTKTTPHAVFQGDSFVRLTTVIANSGDYMAKDVEVSIIGGEYVFPSTATGARAFIPYLPVGEMTSITFIVDVSEDAPPGNHEILLNASGKIMRVFLTVLEKAKFSIRNITQLETERGYRGFRLVLEVENTSHAKAEDVRVELLSPFISGSTSAFIGSMAPGEKRLLSFEIDIDPSTPLGPVTVEVRVKWSQEGRTLTQYSAVTLVISERKVPFEALATLTLLALATSLSIIYAKKEKIQKILTHYISRVKKSTRT